ncbi:MAG TPA: hypothetical protein PK706_01460, partial [Xanthobacteraceae bacterium]|nr:hypothetical protein [Xanthobacteraceae bacterium]
MQESVLQRHLLKESVCRRGDVHRVHRFRRQLLPGGTVHDVIAHGRGGRMRGHAIFRRTRGRDLARGGSEDLLLQRGIFRRCILRHRILRHRIQRRGDLVASAPGGLA